MMPKRGFKGARLALSGCMLLLAVFLLRQTRPGPSEIQARSAGAAPASIAVVRSMARARAFATATTLANGRVLVTGGIDANYNYLASAELFDPVTRTFSSVGAMTAPRAAHTATLLATGQVLIAGGVTCAGSQCASLPSAEIYDPILQQFLPVGPMKAARANHTATLLIDGSVLVAGGVSGPIGLAGAEIYDPVSGRFSDTGSMAAPRFLHSATLLNDGQVLVAGGRSCDGECDENPASNSAEVYDPTRLRFFPAGKLHEGRILHGATLLRDGRVLLTGGRSCVGDCEGDTTLDDSEIYDPDTGRFEIAARMSAARASHQAIPLPDGRVFVYGGARCGRRGGCDYLNTGELFDPGLGGFAPVGNGTVAGTNLAAALMANEQVLVAGGRMRGSIFRSVDVFSFGAQ